MKDPTCDYCSEVYGVCTECAGCFGEHCQCDPCQHGKARVEECVFCQRGFSPVIAQETGAPPAASPASWSENPLADLFPPKP